ncbi:hypothetical protein [Hanstruepera flava]|uniref:hypothetical protein n=1 Tax=Hanstruepera flava TaxID=2930218 RepID=UPI002027A99A|nr:hypothetical protein [Hanstruepera flava]
MYNMLVSIELFNQSVSRLFLKLGLGIKVKRITTLSFNITKHVIPAIEKVTVF